MFSFGYAVLTKGHYDRSTGITISLLDTLLEAFLFYALISLGK